MYVMSSQNSSNRCSYASSVEHTFRVIPPLQQGQLVLLRQLPVNIQTYPQFGQVSDIGVRYGSTSAIGIIPCIVALDKQNRF
jgi:hypothetical protein